jgi:hypothetical protein
VIAPRGGRPSGARDHRSRASTYLGGVTPGGRPPNLEQGPTKARRRPTREALLTAYSPEDRQLVEQVHARPNLSRGGRPPSDGRDRAGSPVTLNVRTFWQRDPGATADMAWTVANLDSGGQPEGVGAAPLASQPRRAVGYSSRLPCPRAPAAAGPGSTPAAPSSPLRPWIARSPGGASRWSATGRGCGRPPSPTRQRGPPRPPRPHGRRRVRRGGGTIVASCAPDQLVWRRRLGGAHRDRKVVGGGAIPLATANTSPATPAARAIQ